MNVIIIGASGQDGLYLTQLLNNLGYSVLGVSRSNNYLKIDLTDYDSVRELVKQYTPDYLFHFAANSTIDHLGIFENHAIICTGLLNILEAVKIYSSDTKVFVTGSGLQFQNKGLPIKETDPFECKDAYSLCRIQSIYLARYFRTLGVKTYVGYLFNHDSPHRKDRHLSKIITSAVCRIANGSNEKIRIGDINVIKEYGFAGDIVKGVWTLVNQENVFEANISVGIGYSVRDWLIECFGMVGKNWEDYVESVQDYVPVYRKLISDPSRIFSLGWKPEISFKQLAQMMLNS